MNVRERELVPTRSRMPLSRDFLVHRNDEMDPLLTLHREMNRVFEEVFRGAFYDPATVPFDRHGIEQGSGWPHIEVAKTGKEMKAIAELPGLDVRMEDLTAVMDAVGLERSAVMGVSEGGPLAALFAATYPERCDALAVC